MSGPPQAPIPQVLLYPPPGDTSIWQVQFLTNTAARDGRALGTEKAMGILHTGGLPRSAGILPIHAEHHGPTRAARAAPGVPEACMRQLFGRALGERRPWSVNPAALQT